MKQVLFVKFYSEFLVSLFSLANATLSERRRIYLSRISGFTLQHAVKINHGGCGPLTAINISSSLLKLHQAPIDASGVIGHEKSNNKSLQELSVAAQQFTSNSSCVTFHCFLQWYDGKLNQ